LRLILVTPKAVAMFRSFAGHVQCRNNAYMVMSSQVSVEMLPAAENYHGGTENTENTECMIYNC
jgi:hypothetical protein